MLRATVENITRTWPASGTRRRTRRWCSWYFQPREPGLVCIEIPGNGWMEATTPSVTGHQESPMHYFPTVWQQLLPSLEDGRTGAVKTRYHLFALAVSYSLLEFTLLCGSSRGKADIYLHAVWSKETLTNVWEEFYWSERCWMIRLGVEVILAVLIWICCHGISSAACWSVHCPQHASSL